jgi:hypothetical protein
VHFTLMNINIKGKLSPHQRSVSENFIRSYIALSPNYSFSHHKIGHQTTSQYYKRLSPNYNFSLYQRLSPSYKVSHHKRLLIYIFIEPSDGFRVEFYKCIGYTTQIPVSIYSFIPEISKLVLWVVLAYFKFYWGLYGKWQK